MNVKMLLVKQQQDTYFFYWNPRKGDGLFFPKSQFTTCTGLKEKNVQSRVTM